MSKLYRREDSVYTGFKKLTRNFCYEGQIERDSDFYSFQIFGLTIGRRTNITILGQSFSFNAATDHQGVRAHFELPFIGWADFEIYDARHWD